MRRPISQEASGYLLIVPTGGLNDVLNQVYHGLLSAESVGVVPIVTLSPGTQYESNLDDLINCTTAGILNLSSIQQRNRFPKIPELESMLSASVKNKPLPISENDFVYFGSGGGIRGSSRLLIEYGLSDYLKKELDSAVRISNLETPAIHIRCSDMSPNKRITSVISENKKTATVYADCDYRKFLSGDHFLDGYSPSGNYSRTGSDLVSLMLLSKHKSLFLTPVQNDDENHRIRFSGFGLLALVIHLRENGLVTIFRSYTVRTLWNLLQMDTRMFAAVIWEASRPTIRVTERPASKSFLDK